MSIIRFAAKVLLVMFVLPALGLIAFHGGLGSGLIAGLLIGVVGFFVTVFALPALMTGGLFAELAGALFAGSFGVRLVSFAIETVLYAITLAIIAGLMSSVSLVGFWSTLGAAAIVAFTSNVLSRHASNS